MRIGTALLTAACIVSGIVVIETHAAYAADAPVRDTNMSDDQGAHSGETPPAAEP
jgi:hypothetical protein